MSTQCCKKDSKEGQNKCCQYKSDYINSYLEYVCSLDVFAQTQKYRGTGIVSTIGPACNNVDTICKMIEAGMNVARFNFSHGDHEFHKKMMDNVREAAKKMQQPIALALDTKGPEIRTGLNKDNAQIELKKDDTVTITTDDAFKESCTAEKIYFDYKALAASIAPGQIILVADGSVVLQTTEIKGNDVVCKVLSGYTFGSRKNVCLPRVKTSLPALSAKDVADIKFGMEQKVDIIFASFIRNADNVKELRTLLDSTEHGKKIKIISKIENEEGVDNISSINQISDGIMVARGDLGMDLDIQKVVVAQKKIIYQCKKDGKPVICATQMLESMISNIRPTRAEVSDVTNAVLDGADCVMLSGESANGKYPVDAVRTLNDICKEAESMFYTKRMFEEVVDTFTVMDPTVGIALAAVSASYKIQADAILVLSTTGRTSQAISHMYPRCVILLVTREDHVARQGHLYRNVIPILYTDGRAASWAEDCEKRFLHAVKYACENDLCSTGSRIVCVCGTKQGPGGSNSMKIVTVGEGKTMIGY